jgi:hypothetical protein
MSPTSDPGLDGLLVAAAAAGMSTIESDRWRHELDPRTLDSCGCRASARAATVALLATGAIAMITRPQRSTVVPGVTASVVAAVIAKVSGQRHAAERERRLSQALHARVGQLGAEQMPHSRP